jgi:hypothetical protein
MIEVAPVVLGSVMIVAGLSAIVARSSLSNFVQDSQRKMFGKLGERLTARSATRSLAIAGGYVAAVGLIIVLLGLFYRR